jgi:hypothetical protein
MNRPALLIVPAAAWRYDATSNVPAMPYRKARKVASVYESSDHGACNKGENCARVRKRAGIDLGSGRTEWPNLRKHLATDLTFRF